MENTQRKKRKHIHLWKFLKPYQAQFYLGILFITLENVLEISLPFLMNKMLVMGMTEDPNTHGYILHANTVYMFGAIMLSFAILALIFGVLSAKMVAYVGRSFGYELRKEEYKKIQEFSFHNLDKFRVNSLITRMTNDVTILSDTFSNAFKPFVRSPLQLLFAIVFSFLISPDLTIVFAVIAPLLTIGLLSVVFISRPRFYKLQTAIDLVNRTTEESLTAMKMVRANAKRSYENSKFEKVDANARNTGASAMTVVACNMGILQFMTYSCVIGTLILGGIGIFDNWHPELDTAVQAANIASFLNYTVQTMNALVMMANVLMLITRATASSLRIGEVFAAESEIVENKDSTLEVDDGRINFDHVYFKYQNSAQEYVLSDISFDIKEGETVGILGETGSSKSSLIYLIERFYDVTYGSVSIGGHNVKDYTLDELRKKTAIAFQSPLLFTGTVKENLLWGNPNASDEEIEEACQIACASDFIHSSLSKGYETMIGQGGNNVSGGQRQRLCIARALLRNPKILILDDSFSALDRITETRLKENLKTKLPKMTKIIISQKVSAIQDADKIIVLKDGKINNIGTGDWLKEHDPIYQDIYNIQKEGH